MDFKQRDAAVRRKEEAYWKTQREKLRAPIRRSRWVVDNRGNNVFTKEQLEHPETLYQEKGRLQPNYKEFIERAKSQILG